MDSEIITGHVKFTFSLEGIEMKVSGVFTIHVAPPPTQPLTESPASGALPDEQVGTAATGEIDISGGTLPYALTPVTGLPPGVSADLDPTGTKVLISGIPTTAGDASFNVEVSDSAPATSAAAIPGFKKA